MAFASSRTARICAAVLLSLALTAGLASTVVAATDTLNVTVTTSPVTAGVADSVTVTAILPGGGTDTGYAGTVHFTSTDLSAVLPTDTTLTSGAGTFSITFKTAGPQTVTATDTVTPSITGISAAIQVTPAAASTLVVTPSTLSTTSGSSFSVTVTAKDQYGNTATGYTGTVHFTSSDSAATLPGDYKFTVGNAGTHPFSGVILNTVAAQTITATDTGTHSIRGTSASINVTSPATDTLSVTVTTSPVTAGVADTVTVTAKNGSATDTGYTGIVRFSSTDGAAVLPANYTFLGSDSGSHTFTSGVTLKTAGYQTVTATDTVTSSITGTSASIQVTPAAASYFVVSGIANPFVAGVADAFTVTAKDQYGNTATGYTGTVHFASSDLAASLPANSYLAGGVGVFSVTLNTSGYQSVTVNDTVYTSIVGSQTVLVQGTGGSPGTYHPLTPARLLDTRNGTGYSGALSANAPITFQVWGLGGVPYNATAVTGNLTVTDATSGWAIFLGPNATYSPTSSTINFNGGQTLANGVTVALSASGSLSATYISTAGNTTDLVFDVTGYFTPDTSGAYYFPITPGRVLDTRSGIGLSGKLTANTPRTFQVTGTGYVPSNATAVTGNLTVTGSTSGWAIFLGPVATASPGSSTINFTAGGIVANGVTVGLSTLGTLSATYISTAGQKTDLVFDVTGYFVQGGSTGARYVAITPTRLLDTRYGTGLYGAQSANIPATFTVWGTGYVPTTALGVTGNLTVTDQTSGWAVFLGPNPTYTPSTSTINFNAGQVVANGVTVGLSGTGTLSATYISTSGNTTDLVFDVTGYFVH